MNRERLVRGRAGLLRGARLRLRYVRRTNTPGLAYQVMFGNSPDNLAPAADPGTVVASDAQTDERDR